MSQTSASDLLERLERAKTDFWAHTRMDCLSEAAKAIAILAKERDNLEAVLRAKPTGTAAQRERQLEKRVATAEASNEALRVALEPLSRLEIPNNPQGNAGFYSIRHSDIIRARALTQPDTSKEKAG